ncbi:MAG: histidine kinase [Polaribacter sp.]|uniref:sensor histidine kinase n=1 Tax=Polaribacter sp. TaxID=1920175 RepID=UPI002F35F94D
MELFFQNFPTWLQGVLFILIIYHAVSYFYTKDKSFAIYAGYLLLVAIYLITKTTNESSNYISEKFHSFFIGATWIIQIYYWMLYSWFSIHFLNLKVKDKKLANLITRYILITSVFCTLFFIIDLVVFDRQYMAKFFMLVFTPVSLLIVFFILKTMYRIENKINKFFVFGLIFFLGFSLLALYFSTIREYPFEFVRPIDLFMIGVLLEAITISIGLGYKFHIYRQERDDYNLLLITELKNNEALKDQLNEKLSEKVEIYKLSEIETLYEKQINELRLTSLLSQMNPHFIFNALNSIKLYIINNEQKLAARYLNKFSKLIRRILEASNTKEISLQEELETMDLYMAIENIRFSNEIDFQIKFDDTLKLQTIKIPPLVLQPFLENAIWHGLSSKKSNKNIILSVNEEDKKYILITIEDNGIGRTASAKIKSEKSINRKSIGINLTRERLSNFVKNLKNDYSIIYEDLIDESKTAIGTKVILKIPLF